MRHHRPDCFFDMHTYLYIPAPSFQCLLYPAGAGYRIVFIVLVLSSALILFFVFTGPLCLYVVV